MIKKMLLIILAFTLLSCIGKPSIDDKKLSELKFNLEEFFNGRVLAHGQFQDRFGSVRSRFEVDINGSFNGQTLILKEQFLFSDGSSQTRIWTLEKTGRNEWQGTATDISDLAIGYESGDTFNWKYSVNLPVGDRIIKVNFDDWMWLISEKRLLNKAYVQKFGVNVGEVIIFFEKTE